MPMYNNTITNRTWTPAWWKITLWVYYYYYHDNCDSLVDDVKLWHLLPAGNFRFLFVDSSSEADPGAPPCTVLASTSFRNDLPLPRPRPRPLPGLDPGAETVWDPGAAQAGLGFRVLAAGGQACSPLGPGWSVGELWFRCYRPRLQKGHHQ